MERHSNAADLFSTSNTDLAPQSPLGPPGGHSPCRGFCIWLPAKLSPLHMVPAARTAPRFKLRENAGLSHMRPGHDVTPQDSPAPDGEHLGSSHRRSTQNAVWLASLPSQALTHSAAQSAPQAKTKARPSQSLSVPRPCPRSPPSPKLLWPGPTVAPFVVNKEP